MLNWFADGAMTLLGYQVEKPYEAPSDTLGIFSVPGDPTDEGGCLNAMTYLEGGGEKPLMAKAERKSTVHRRVPLDLVVVPIRGADGKFVSEEGIEFWGQSFVASPDGQVVARASSDKEEILVVPCDLSRVEFSRTHWPFLRDRRIDAYGPILKRMID